MNEIKVLNENIDLLISVTDKLVDTSNGLNDVKEMLNDIDSPIVRTAVRALDVLSKDALTEYCKAVKEIYENEKDERSEYLDNLRGYFNEETGTWYEQICRNYTKLTGFTANKWDALTWTIHLSSGHSTLDYLLHHGTIKKDSNGDWKTFLPLEKLGEYGDNVERIQYLIDTDFKELA